MQCIKRCRKAALTAMVAASAMIALWLCSCENSANTDAKAQQSVSPTDITINEVLSSNSSSMKAYDGRYYDWIELYNPKNEEVSLDGYYLSDDVEAPQKCPLAGQKIAAHGYLVIYCSGLNMVDEKGCLHTNFKLSAANGETVCLSNASSITSLTVPASEENVSYGLSEDGVTYLWYDKPTPGKSNTGPASAHTSPVVINEYMLSNTFTIYDCEGDYGDWVELYNTSSKSVDISAYGLTDDETDPLKYVFPEGTVIKADSYLLVFCDGKNKTDKNGLLHTNFSLSARDGSISLYTSGKELCGRVPLYELPDNISCGRAGGGEEYQFFARPTPGEPNKTTAYKKLTADISPDINDGVLISETLSASSKVGSRYKNDYIELYNSTGRSVALKGYTICRRPGEVLYTFPDVSLGADKYLLIYCDGVSDKKTDKALYAPIKISTGGETIYLADASGKVCDVYSTGMGRNGMSSGRIGGNTGQRVFFATPTPGQPNSGRYYTSFAPVPKFDTEGGVVRSGTSVSLSVDGDYTVVYTTDGSEPKTSSNKYTGPIKIKSNTVIRAAAYSKECYISECATQTYLVDNPHTIPILCMSGKPDDLNEGKGIFINESNASEQKVYVEYFNKDGEKEVQFPCGTKLFGYSSRKCPQKGVKLCLREIYGVNEVTYPFFSGNSKAADTFSTILLRPSGEDQIFSKLRDELIPALIRGKMDLDYQEFQACALYINGRYWGLYYIREHLGADYLKSYYGYEKGTYDLIKAQHLAQEGSVGAYKKLTEFCKKNDLTKKENYEYLCSVVDMDSLINFWIVETYFGNTDTVNIRCYKHRDGKWRWMIYDFDWSMQTSPYNRHKNYIDAHLLDPKGHGIGNFDNSIIRNLLKNDEFKDRFITAYCYHLNNTFAPDRAVAILDGMAEDIGGEIKLNQSVWGRPDYKTWNKTTVPFLRDYLRERPGETRNHLMKSFKLTEDDWNRYVTLSKDYRQENDPVK